MQQPAVRFRHHDAEPYKFSVETLERRAVPDHESCLNAPFKHIKGCDPVFYDLYEQEIGVWLVRYIPDL